MNGRSFPRWRLAVRWTLHVPRSVFGPPVNRAAGVRPRWRSPGGGGAPTATLEPRPRDTTAMCMLV
eukprot:4979732-Prymnesium_polylepis.1